MVPSKGLVYINAILEMGSFSSAAERLFISQPSLSAYIKNIEKNLGAEIFDRKSYKIKLTQAGKIYVKTEEQIVNLYHRRNEEIRDLQNLKSGELIIGSSLFSSYTTLSVILPLFRKRYPQISIQLIEGTSQELERMSNEGTVDMSIVTLPLQYKNELTYEKIHEENIFIATTLYTADVNDGRQPIPEISFSELKDLPFIIMQKGQNMRELFFDICRETSIYPNIILETAGLMTAYKLVSVGMGATLVTDRVVRHVLLEHPPKLFSLREGTSQRTIVVAYSNKRKLSHAAQAFIEVLKDHHT